MREAVRELLAIPGSGFRAGPDTDTLGPSLRNVCHFTVDGAARAAAMWAELLAPAARVAP